MSDETRGTVVVALAANVAVAAAKLAAGLLTGSAAVLSEAAHSFADTLNEVSLRRSARPADRTHPFGYGKERFFYSLLAAVGIFVSGAGFAAYQASRLSSGPARSENRPRSSSPRSMPYWQPLWCSKGRRCARHCGRSP